MKGDFTRNTFDLSKHYRRVLMQQGRVQVDADWNEMMSIMLHLLQTLTQDLVGAHAGPTGENLGFEIVPEDGSLKIGSGHYYVDGILCMQDHRDENGVPGALSYTEQCGYPFPHSVETFDANEDYLVYLDVWERHITYVQDDSIREKALGGPDTCTRAEVIGQVKAQESTYSACSDVEDNWSQLVEDWQPANRGRLKARATIPDSIDTIDRCIIPPDARYRGAENQLYRVEIHRGGEVWDGAVDARGNPAGNAQRAATFKWSRDNGSVVFPLYSTANITTQADTGVSTETLTATLEHLGREPRFGLAVDDWVELVDDDYELRGAAEPLWQVDAIDGVTMEVSLKRRDAAPSAFDVGQDMSKNPLLRRWDHKAGNPTEGGLELDDGAALIVEGSGDGNWLKLEDGVEIQFQSGAASYRSGDYWLIPARTETQDVEWPQKQANPGVWVPVDVPPHGVDHHYAPLAIISLAANLTMTAHDCRYQFKLTKEPVTEP